MNRMTGRDRGSRADQGAGTSTTSSAGSRVAAGAGVASGSAAGKATGGRWVGFTFVADGRAGVI